MTGSDCTAEAPENRSIKMLDAQHEAFPEMEVDTLVLHGTRNGYQVSDKNFIWIPDTMHTDMIGQDEELPPSPFGTSAGPQADLIGLLLPGLDYMA